MLFACGTAVIAGSQVSVLGVALAFGLALIAAAYLLAHLASGALAGYGITSQGLAQNGWGAGYLGGYGLGAAFLFEVVATFIFVLVIAAATGKGSHPATAGLAIGLTLTVMHLVGIRITGTSVNPARSKTL